MWRSHTKPSTNLFSCYFVYLHCAFQISPIPPFLPPFLYVFVSLSLPLQEPPKTSTGYNSASHHCSIRTEPSTSTTSHLTDIQPHCIVVESAGHCSTSLLPVKKEAFSLGSQGHSSLRHPSSQNHVSSRDGPPGSSNTCKEAEEDSEVVCAYTVHKTTFIEPMWDVFCLLQIVYIKDQNRWLVVI